MRKLSLFNFISLNGFYKGPNEDIQWHKHGPQESEYGIEAMQSDNILLFGRKTYEMMKSYWPTPMAAEQNPKMAESMNKAEKIVCSRTLQQADWNNTTIIKNLVPDIQKLKQSDGKDITILGSGSIITQLAENNLIDIYQYMIDPVAIGDGTPILKGLIHELNLKLSDHRIFKSGVVLLSYEPV